MQKVRLGKSGLIATKPAMGCLPLQRCGMAEAEMAPAVSPRIIINEYVEISKYYSTPESSAFVNGLLDKLINQHE